MCVCVCGRGVTFLPNPVTVFTIQLYYQVSVHLHEECCVVPSTLITQASHLTFLPTRRVFRRLFLSFFIVIPEFWFQHTAEWCSRPCLSLTGQRDRLGMGNKKDRKNHGHHFSEEFVSTGLIALYSLRLLPVNGQLEKLFIVSSFSCNVCVCVGGGEGEVRVHVGGGGGGGPCVCGGGEGEVRVCVCGVHVYVCVRRVCVHAFVGVYMFVCARGRVRACVCVRARA